MSASVSRMVSGLTLARLKRTVLLGLKSLWLHRLRSLLTMMGIVFGVMSVISMLAIGEGASYEAQEQIRKLGSNNVILESVKPPEDRSSGAERSFIVEYGLTYADVRRIERTIPGVEIVLPSRIIRSDVWFQSRRVDCDIVGTLASYPEMRNHHVAKGRYFTEEEFEANENVCVLGHGMAEALFPLYKPIGKSVRESSGGRVRIGLGSLYRILARLLNSGLVEEAETENVDSDDGSRRRTYCLTALGLSVLRAEVHRLSDAVELTRSSRLFADREA